jgi:hypothetical protein
LACEGLFSQVCSKVVLWAGLSLFLKPNSVGGLTRHVVNSPKHKRPPPSYFCDEKLSFRSRLTWILARQIRCALPLEWLFGIEVLTCGEQQVFT